MSISGLFVLKKLDLDEEKTQLALLKLLVDRKNEFRELTEILLRPQKSMSKIDHSEEFVLNFCLDVKEAFKTWSGQMNLSPNSGLKALTILRQLSRGKTTMNQLAHLLNISYSLANDFQEIYRRL